MAVVPPEIIRLIARVSGVNCNRLRTLCKGFHILITKDDVIWAETGQRFFQCGLNDCWLWLAGNGHLKILRIYGKDVWQTTLHRALWMAALHGHVDVVRFIREPDMEASMQLILEVSGRGHLDVLKELLTFPRRDPRLLDAVSAASKAGHIATVETLLEAVRYQRTHFKIALIELVILEEDFGLQRLSMIAFRENQHFALVHALSNAVRWGKASAVDILLSNGARFLANRNARDVLSAVLSGQPGILGKVLDAGVPPAPHFSVVSSMLQKGEITLDVAIRFLDLLLTDSNPAGWKDLALEEAEGRGLLALADHIRAR